MTRRVAILAWALSVWLMPCGWLRAACDRQMVHMGMSEHQWCRQLGLVHNQWANQVDRQLHMSALRTLAWPHCNGG